MQVELTSAGSSWSRVKALFMQQFFLSRRLVELWFDLIVFSIVATLVFGYIGKYLSTGSDPLPGQYLLIGMVMWEIIRLTQYCITVNTLWTVWSHNLSNMFVTPVAISEYMLSYLASAIATMSVIVSALALVVYLAFGFNILDIGVTNLLVGAVALIMFAWAVGTLILGLIFRYGLRIQALSWGLVFLFQPLCGIYFPIDVLPDWAQMIAKLFPPTYVMIAARDGLVEGTTQWNDLAMALVLGVVYCVGALVLFLHLFNRSRIVGQFARNDL